MAKYVSLESLMEFPIRRNHYDREHGNEDFINGIESVLEYAEHLPAANVEPVRHGRWEWDLLDIYRCSVCGEKSKVKEVMNEPVWYYCPNCGAKMDVG